MIVWIDTETTGIDPNGGELLEIALVVTDDNLNELVYWTEVIHHDLDESTLDEWIIKTHGESGLLAEVNNSRQSLAEVESDIVKGLLCEFDASALRKTPIGGSSVGFDRKWLEVHMPSLHALFSHRTVDISTVSELAERWSPKVQQKRKKALQTGTAHRALDDIRYSIASARYFQKHLFSTGLVARVRGIFAR